MTRRSVLYCAVSCLAAHGVLFANAAEAPKPAACTRPAMIIFDASGSMAAGHEGESRMQAAKRAMARIVPSVSSVRPLGLTVYSGSFVKCDNIRLLVPPSLASGTAILSALDEVSPGGATPLGAAVRSAVTYFRSRGEAASLVVVTDGAENCGDNICRLASQIASGQPALEVHVIGYGLLSDQTEDMNCLAARNSGRATLVNSTDELAKALQEALSCPAVS